MFCPKCGKQIPEGAKFCGGCGNPVRPLTKMSTGSQIGITDKAKKPSIPMPSANLPSGMAMMQNTRDEERRNRKLTIILCIVLFVLVLVAVGMGIYYFKVLEDNGGNSSTNQIEQADDREDKVGEDAETEDEEEPEQAQQPADTQETEETAGVVSDTNEVIADKILENIPKAVYSYQFNEDLGNAEVVVRNAPETEPEKTDNIEPQYIHGMDGKAIYLDGTYGIKLSDVERVGDSYTVAFWMKADRLCDWSPFIHIGHDLNNPEKRVRLWLGQKTEGVSIAPIISSERAEVKDSFEIRPEQFMPNTVEPDIWYYIVFTVDASKQGSRSGSVLGTLYVAGQYIGQGDIVLDTMNVDEFDVYLGINCWDELYPVAFDDVKIWNQVLDSGQVQELYNAYE